MSTQQLLEQNSVNKPGTSCLGCRRRKLKCTREAEGCRNCVKSDLFCVYPAPEAGVKRKRGPYKKDKPPRQRHLEDLVRYLEPTASSSRVLDDDGRAEGGKDSAGRGVDDAPQAGSTPDLSRSVSRLSTALTTAGSEGLVKDALIALTRSSNNDSEPRVDDTTFSLRAYNAAHFPQSSSNLNSHPPSRQIFEYWHLFSSRVDPMIKLIHCPTFAKKLFSLVDNININNIPSGTNVLLFAIYYAAVSSCTATETRRRFGEAQETLLRRYGRSVEIAVGETMDTPGLEMVQGLVLYMICIRHQTERANLPYLFNLAVRSASHISLHHDSTGRFTPFEAEMRRRLWHHLRGLENRTAEDASSRREPSLLQTHTIRLPSNINDNDLHPAMSTAPSSRTDITDMTFPLLRFEIHKLVFTLVSLKKRHKSSASGPSSLREEQTAFFASTVSHLQAAYLNHLDVDTRPYDWMCATLVQGLLLKGQLIIDFPEGLILTPTTPPDERMYLLRTSVSIIQLTNSLASPSTALLGKGCEDYTWFFRDFIQWHSLAIVIAELGQSRNEEFRDAAWEVLGPLLEGWDDVVEEKRGSKEWAYVDGLIQRARARKVSRGSRKSKRDGDQSREGDSRTKSSALTMPDTTPHPDRSFTTEGRIYVPQDHATYHEDPQALFPAGPAAQRNGRPAGNFQFTGASSNNQRDRQAPLSYEQPSMLPYISPALPQNDSVSNSFVQSLTTQAYPSSDLSPANSELLNFADLDFSAFETVFGQADFWFSGVEGYEFGQVYMTDEERNRVSVDQ